MVGATLDIEELRERLEDGLKGDLLRGELLRGVLGTRLGEEFIREQTEEKVFEKLFTLSGLAWRELLVEKLKAEIDKTQGEHLTTLAKFVATARAQKWNNSIEMIHKREEFRDQLNQIFATAHR